MLCLLFFIFVLISGLSIGSVLLCIFADIGCEFFPILGYITETIASVTLLWGEIAVYLFTCILEVADALIKHCIHVLPIVSNIIRHISNSFPYIINEIVYHLQQIRDFLSDKRESLLLCWALMLIPLFIFSNKVRIFFHGNNRTNQNRNVLDSDDDVYDESDGRQRLYPDLQNDNGTGNSNVRAQNADENLKCGICYNRNRNTAVFPCGHTQTCEQCIRRVMADNKKCPHCLADITEYRAIYL
jgi:hypothetical protein